MEPAVVDRSPRQDTNRTIRITEAMPLLIERIVSVKESGGGLDELLSNAETTRLITSTRRDERPLVIRHVAYCFALPDKTVRQALEAIDPEAMAPLKPRRKRVKVRMKTPTGGRRVRCGYGGGAFVPYVGASRK